MEQIIKPIKVIRKPRGWVVALTLSGERCIDDDLVKVKKGFIVAATQEAVEKFWPENSIEGLARKREILKRDAASLEKNEDGLNEEDLRSARATNAKRIANVENSINNALIAAQGGV